MLEAEGLTELETNKGARVPLLESREVDLLYQMRERLEPLALTESIPRLVQAQLDRLEELQSRDRELAGCGRVSRSRPRVPSPELLRVATWSPLFTTVTRLWNSTQYYRRIYMTLTGAGEALDCQRRAQSPPRRIAPS